MVFLPGLKIFAVVCLVLVESACLLLLVTARAVPPTSAMDWSTALAEAVVPLLHGIIAAGSEQCEDLKKILGLSYEQIQARNAPDTEESLTLNHITPFGTHKFNMSLAPKSIGRSTDFDQRKKLVILIHGFMENAEGMMVQVIAKEFLERGGYNILALDGGSLVKMLYFRSSTYVRFIGEKLGEVLAGFVNDRYNPEDITVIGHSLGAHVAGISGKEFTRLTGRRLGRITGLDPAGPCFSHAVDGARLQRGDAEYVDVIHTDGGLLGLKEPIGDQDYFPNGGSLQPGCGLPPCCHSRAWMLYADSVRDPTTFPGTLCSDWSSFSNGSCAKAAQSFMGEGSVPSIAGSYFLVAHPPSYDEGSIMMIT